MQPCPRMIEDGLWPDKGPFKVSDPVWREDGTCSYCGSMKPVDFFDAIEQGKSLDPTDKDYKVYVNHTQKFYFQHLVRKEKRRFVDLVNTGKITTKFHVLPFFMYRKTTAAHAGN